MLDRIPRLEYKAGIFALTGICGLIDVACFLGLGGVFAELMTGNLLLTGIAIGTGNLVWVRVAIYASAFIPFALGALAAGMLTNGRHPGAARIIGYPVEFVMICAATLLALITNPPLLQTPGDLHESDCYLWQRAAIVGLLSFAMGIHNAFMRKHGVADIATNVMTLTLAGLISESRAAGGKSPHWQRRLASLVIFVVGAALGGWLLVTFGSAGPLVAATILFALALDPLVTGRTPVDAQPAT